MELSQIINSITSRLIAKYPVQSIILFGSAAQGTMTPESDIDIIVILDITGRSSTYSEMLKRRNEITSTLIDIRKHVAVDMLVYTKDEWDILVQDNSSFIREIMKTGKKIA